MIINPYKEVIWSGAGAWSRYKANFHTHSKRHKLNEDGSYIMDNEAGYSASSDPIYCSDGQVMPHIRIQKYAEWNYDILALTDHDSMCQGVTSDPASLWLRDGSDNLLTPIDFPDHNCQKYNVYVDAEKSRNMLLLRGNELSVGDHYNSLFNDMWSSRADYSAAHAWRGDLDLTKNQVTNKNGYSFIAHPSRYDTTTEWYVQYYLNHPTCFGIEACNRLTWLTNVDKWDYMLKELMPFRPVWGLSNTDDHSGPNNNWVDMGRNYNMMMMKDFTPGELRRSLLQGEFYFIRDSGSPNINRHVPEVGSPLWTNVEVVDDTITITYSSSCAYHRWFHNNELILENPAGTTATFNFQDYPDLNYIRMFSYQSSYRIFSQPFGFINTQEGGVAVPKIYLGSTPIVMA